jgi:hypothetical protein
MSKRGRQRRTPGEPRPTEDRRWQIEGRRWRIDLAIGVGALLLAAVAVYLGFFRGGPFEEFSMSFANRLDLLPEQVDHSKPRVQIEAVIRNTSDHDLILTFVGFNITRRDGMVLSIGNAQPVPPALPFSRRRGLVLRPGVGQLFYVNLPEDRRIKSWFEPGRKGTISALTSDGRTLRSKPELDFFYVGG